MGVSNEGVTNFTGVQIGSGIPDPYVGSTFTGSPLYGQSATSFAGVAMTVQGSASSFSVFVWPAVRRGDFISIAPVGAGVSSLSSGLVLHSHCTQNGQCEVRWSNVSTLAQAQSAITYFIARLSFFL